MNKRQYIAVGNYKVYMFEDIDNDVVYNHILTEVDNRDLWSMMNVNRNYKELSKKFVDNKAIERINNVFDNIFFDDPYYKKRYIRSTKDFKQYLQTTKATIAGGFVLRSILNTNWLTNINIYLPETITKRFLLDKTVRIFDEVNYLNNRDYSSSEEEDDRIKLKYVVGDYYKQSNKMEIQNISCLQRVCVYLSNTRECDKHFDFRICQNMYWYDGKDNIKITNYCDVLTGNCKITKNKKNKYYERLEKYIGRGFSFVKSKLFSYFIDYLQKYTEKELEYNNWTLNKFISNTVTKYKVTSNKIQSSSSYDHKIRRKKMKKKCADYCKLCCGKKYCYDIVFETEREHKSDYVYLVDDINCFHYDKWQKDRTICADCYKIFIDTHMDNYYVKVNAEDYQYNVGGIRLQSSIIDNKIMHIQFLEADNISEIIKNQYNLQ